MKSTTQRAVELLEALGSGSTVKSLTYEEKLELVVVAIADAEYDAREAAIEWYNSRDARDRRE